MMNQILKFGQDHLPSNEYMRSTATHNAPNLFKARLQNLSFIKFQQTE